MKHRLLALWFALLMVCGLATVAHAAVSTPVVYCDGSRVTSQRIYEYDIADGTLTIKWDKQSDAGKYYYKCIGLDEKPDFTDNYQSSRGTVLAEKTVTSHTTSSRKFTVSTSKMDDYDYLKIAIAAYDSAGKAYWLNFGVELTDSDKIVASPALYCDGSSVDSREIVGYDLADGSLTIKWTPQSAAAHYYYKCIGLNEKPDFTDSYQGNRGTTLAEATVTSNSTTKCKFTLSTGKLEDYKYLKVAVAAYDADGKAYWKNFGVKLSDSSVKEMTLSDASLSFAAGGDSDTVTVSGVSSFTVSHPTENEKVAGNKWLTVVRSGSVISISARANYGASSRSETVTVVGSDGQTKKIKVTQTAGYAAPTASLKIGSRAYSSGDTYGPLANGGKDTLWLSITVKNAQRIHVASNNADIGSKTLTMASSATAKAHECGVTIPEGLTPGTYTFTIYVSNSNVENDKWSQAITPITLNVKVVKEAEADHRYYLLGGYIDYVPGQDYFTESKTKECTGDNSVKGGTCKSIEYNGGWQCAGFAMYVEKAIYGQLGTYLDGKTSGLLASSSVTVDSLRNLIQRAGVGANIRAGKGDKGHSMVVTSVSDTGFGVIHANWDNCCGISTKWFSYESFKSWLDGKGYGIIKIRVHNERPVATPTTFSGSINGLTVRLGETAQLSGAVNLQGNSSINRVTVNVQGYYAGADARVYTRTFSNGETAVKLQDHSEFVVNTKAAPFNTAGTYTIRLWASAHDGTNLTEPIAEATVIVAEPVSSVPACTEDELFRHLYHTLGVNEGSYGTVNANDRGSASIGRIQWNANSGRALPLLKKIVAKNPTDAHAILGDALYNEIAGNSGGYWSWANRTFNADEKARVSRLLTTSYGIEVQDEQIRYDLTTKNLATIRNRGVTDPWAIVYLADIYNVGDYTKTVINNAAAEVGSADKITLDIAHKYTRAHSVYGSSDYTNRLRNTYNYLTGVTFNGRHYNDSAAATPTPAPAPVAPGEQDNTAIESITFSAVGAIKGQPGGNATVPISINNPYGVKLGSITLYYTLPAGVTVSRVTACGAAANASVQYHDAFIFASDINEGISGNGQVLSVTFAVAETAAMPLTFSLRPEIVAADLSADATPAPISVNIEMQGGARVPGDANADGKVNSRDALTVVKYASGQIASLNIANADVNADGKVNSRDALAIIKYAAGQGVTLK